MKKLYLIIMLLCLAASVKAQVVGAYGADSAEKVNSALVTAIPSSQTIDNTHHYKVAITLGSGYKFARIQKPFIVTCAPQVETPLTNIEEFLCDSVSNDTLLLVERSISNTTTHTWAAGSYIGYRLTAWQFKQIWDTIHSLSAAPPGSGTVTSVTSLSPLTMNGVANGTGTTIDTIGIPQANGSQSGFLSSANWTLFNNKQASVSASYPVLLSGTTISVDTVNGSHPGIATAYDYNLWNSVGPQIPSFSGDSGLVLSNDGTNLLWSRAGSGTVTNVNVSGGTTGLTTINRPITTYGTITLGGTLGIANGGTNANTAYQALLNLLPSTIGHVGEVLTVSPLDSSVIWDTTGGVGTVTSVNVIGGSTGLTTSGGPVTSAGTITLGGTLAIGSGGTGATTANAALNALLPSQSGHSGDVLTSGGANATWIAPAAAPTGANPTATIGTSAVNGTATTFMRSDAAPAFGNLTGDVTSVGMATSIASGSIGNAKLTNSSITVTGGTGLGVSGSPVSLGGTVTLSNTGVTSIVAGSGVTVSGATGAVTVASTQSGALNAIDSVSGDSTGLGFIRVNDTVMTMDGVLYVSSGGTGRDTWNPYMLITAPPVIGDPLTQGTGYGHPGQILTSDTASGYPYWSTPCPCVFLPRPYPVDSGGTGDTTLAPYRVLLGNGTGPIAQVTGTGTSGYVLTSNGSSANPTWQPGGGGGSGTVTSVSSNNLSPLFTASVATATTTPVISYALSTVAPNVFYGRPDSASTGTTHEVPTFRSIVVNDLPNGLRWFSAYPMDSVYNGSGDPANPLPNPGTGLGNVAIGIGADIGQTTNAHAIAMGVTADNGSPGSGAAEGAESVTMQDSKINAWESPMGATGENAFTMGYNAWAAGVSSVIMGGESNQTFGPESGIFAGLNNRDTSSWYSAIIAGEDDSILNYSSIVTNSAVILGGHNLKAKDTNQIVAGCYNTPGAGALTIGNGSPTATSNLWNLGWNGSLIDDGDSIIGYNKIIPVSAGGTGKGSVTANGMMYASSSLAIASTASPTNGQLLIGSTSANPVLATLTGGTGISVTNAAGSITIAATGGAGMSNPMTTVGDVIVGGTSGTPNRLAVGTAYQVFGDSTGTPLWETLLTNSTLSGNGFNPAFGINLATANTWTGSVTINKAGIGTTLTNGLVLGNSTLASGGGAQQFPGSIVLWGSSELTTLAVDTSAIRLTMKPQPNGFNVYPEFDIDGAAATASSYVSIAKFIGTSLSGNTPSLNLSAYTSAYQIDGFNVIYLPNGISDIAIGAAMNTTMTGVNDIGIGIPNSGGVALSAITSGASNIAIGGDPGGNVPTLGKCTSGSYNIAIGIGSLYGVVTANGNVAVGYKALASTTSADNIALGHQAGYTNTTGSGNIFLGAFAGGNSPVAENEIVEIGSDTITSGAATAIKTMFVGEGRVTASGDIPASNVSISGTNMNTGTTSDTAMGSMSLSFYPGAPTIGANSGVGLLNFYSYAAGGTRGNTAASARLTFTIDSIGTINAGHEMESSTAGAVTFDGTGVTAGTVSGGDINGAVTITTAINATGGYVQVLFATPYLNAPTVVACPSNALGVTAMSGSPTLWVSSTTAYFRINFTATAIAAGATFNYIVKGNPN